MISALVAYVGCAVLRHPPMTSMRWDHKVEDAAIDAYNRFMRQNPEGEFLVSCACGRRMVSPVPRDLIWKANQRQRREGKW